MILRIAAVGALGGLIKMFLAHEFGLPHIDLRNMVWSPGWIENIFVGAIAAVIFWVMYGPFASLDIFREDLQSLSCDINHLGLSFLLCLGGGKILTTLAEKQAEKIRNQDFGKIYINSLKLLVPPA